MNNNYDQEELSPWTFHGYNLMIRRSDGYIYISDILKKYNKTIDQWLESYRYTDFLNDYKKILDSGITKFCHLQLNKFRNNIVVENINNITIDLLRDLMIDIEEDNHVFIHEFLVSDFMYWLDIRYGLQITAICSKIINLKQLENSSVNKS